MTLPETTVSVESPQITISGKISKTAGYYTAFVGLGLTAAVLGPTLPGLAAHTQTDLSEISFIFTAQALGILFGSFLGGRLYDRVPGHTVIATALIIMTITMFLVPLMPLLWLLTTVLLVLGVAAGALDVGGNTLLVWVHRHRVAPFMNGLHFCFGFGAFLAPLIIAQAMLMSDDITWAYWILALLILPVAFWLLRLPSPTAPTTAEGQPVDQANRLLVALIALFFFLFVGAEISFGGWIFTYALELDLANETTAAYLTSIFWGALTLGRLVAIPISIRFGPRSMLLGDLAGTLVSGAILLLWPDSIIMLWLGVFGMGFSLASIFPTTLSLAERLMSVTGRITGWFLVGAGLGSMLVPLLIGQFFESVGPQVVMLAIFVALVLALAVFGGVIVYSTRLMRREA